MNEIITLNGLIPSKKSAESVRAEIYSKVESGEVDPIKVQASIKFLEKVFNGDDKKNNGLLHLIKDQVVTEIEKAPGRTDYYGFEVSVGEAGARYNFSNCNYPKLEELYNQQEELKKQITEAENMLKGIPKGGHIIMIDEETGEQIKVFAPVKFSSTSAKFLLK